MNETEVLKKFFEHQDYRALLKDLYDTHKARNPRFSYRFFARIAGFGSASFLKRVIDGESELSENSIEKIIKGFKLKKDEARFFTHLVLLNQSTSSEEKQRHAREILNIKSYRKALPLSEAQFNLYARWYSIPIRELVSLPEFQENPEWISKRLIPEITSSEASRALHELLELGLLERNLEGRLVQANRLLSTSDEVSSTVIASWHKEMMKRAAESIDKVPRGERDISSVTLRISRENLKPAKELIQKFRKELVEVLSGDTFDSIYELNLQLFPLTNQLAERETDK